MKHKPNKNSTKIRNWIRNNPLAMRRKLRTFLEGSVAGKHGITHALHAHSTAALRREIVAKFKLK